MVGNITEKIIIRKVNAVHISIDCGEGVARELNQTFSFEVPGAKHSPLAKRGLWDARIKLFNLSTRKIYFGLWPQIMTFATERGYECVLEGSGFDRPQYTEEEASQFIDSLDLPDWLEKRNYQTRSLSNAVSKGRTLFLSPTASGKSAIIYSIFRYFNVKTLLIVPNSNLLLQMQKDFKSYGYDQPIGQWGDSVKNAEPHIVVSTWQSAVKEDKIWLSQFDMVICDEAHLASSQSIRSIMEKLTVCELRFGFTGTLNGSKCHQMVLEGLFGPVIRVETTANLIEQGILAPMKVEAIKLNHPQWARKYVRKNCKKYPEEIEYLLKNEKRNKFIRNLALSRKGNTLVLFNEVDKHGEILYRMIQRKAPDRNVYYISGKIGAKRREEIRALLEEQEDVILVASTGTFSTGANVKKLDNLICARPWKSQIINLQSIGRILRNLPGKKAYVYDIADDLALGYYHNHTLKHLSKRLETYAAEEFDYQIYNIELDYSYEDAKI